MHFQGTFLTCCFLSIICNSYKQEIFSSSQVGKIGLMLTVLYGLMMVPIMLLYRYLELQTNLEVNTVPRLEERMENVSGRKYPPRYDESECHFRFLIHNTTSQSVNNKVLSVMCNGTTGRPQSARPGGRWRGEPRTWWGSRCRELRVKMEPL